jgi:hypothetical protein
MASADFLMDQFLKQLISHPSGRDQPSARLISFNCCLLIWLQSLWGQPHPALSILVPCQNFWNKKMLRWNLLDRFGFIHWRYELWDRGFVQRCPIDEPAVRNYFYPCFQAEISKKTTKKRLSLGQFFCLLLAARRGLVTRCVTFWHTIDKLNFEPI